MSSQVAENGVSSGTPPSDFLQYIARIFGFVFVMALLNSLGVTILTRLYLGLRAVVSKIQEAISETRLAIPQINQTISSIKSSLSNFGERISKVDLSLPKLTSTLARLEAAITQILTRGHDRDTEIKQLTSRIAELEYWKLQLLRQRERKDDQIVRESGYDADRKIDLSKHEIFKIMNNERERTAEMYATNQELIDLRSEVQSLKEELNQLHSYVYDLETTAEMKVASPAWVHQVISEFRSDLKMVWASLRLLGIDAPGHCAQIFASAPELTVLKAMVGKLLKELGVFKILKDSAKDWDCTDSDDFVSILKWVLTEVQLLKKAMSPIIDIQGHNIKELTKRLDRLDVNLFGCSYVQEIATEGATVSQEINLGDVIRNLDYRIRSAEDKIEPTVVRPGKKSKLDAKAIEASFRDLRDKIGFLYNDVHSALEAFDPIKKVESLKEAFVVLYEKMFTDQQILTSMSTVFEHRKDRWEEVQEKVLQDLAMCEVRLDRLDKDLFTGDLSEVFHKAGVSSSDVSLPLLLQNMDWRIRANRETFDTWLESQGHLIGPKTLTVKQLQDDFLDLRGQVSKLTEQSRQEMADDSLFRYFCTRVLDLEKQMDRLSSIEQVLQADSASQETISESQGAEMASEFRSEIQKIVKATVADSDEKPPRALGDFRDQIRKVIQESLEDKVFYEALVGERIAKDFAVLELKVEHMKADFNRIIWSITKSPAAPVLQDLVVQALQDRLDRLDEGLFNADGPMGYLPGLGTNLATSLYSIGLRLKSCESRLSTIEGVKDTGSPGFGQEPSSQLQTLVDQLTTRLQRLEGAVEITFERREVRLNPDASFHLTPDQQKTWMRYIFRKMERLEKERLTNPLKTRDLAKEREETGLPMSVVKRLLMMEGNLWSLKYLLFEALGYSGISRYLPKLQEQTLAGLHQRVLRLERSRPDSGISTVIQLPLLATPDGAYADKIQELSPLSSTPMKAGGSGTCDEEAEVRIEKVDTPPPAESNIDPPPGLELKPENDFPVVQWVKDGGQKPEPLAPPTEPSADQKKETAADPLSSDSEVGGPVAVHSIPWTGASDGKLQYIIKNTNFFRSPTTISYIGKFGDQKQRPTILLTYSNPYTERGDRLTLSFTSAEWEDLIRKGVYALRYLKDIEIPRPPSATYFVTKAKESELLGANLELEFEVIPSPSERAKSSDGEARVVEKKGTSDLKVTLALTESGVGSDRSSSGDSTSEESVVLADPSVKRRLFVESQPPEGKEKVLCVMPALSSEDFERKANEELELPEPDSDLSLKPLEGPDHQPDFVLPEPPPIQYLGPLIKCICDQELEDHSKCHLMMTRFYEGHRSEVTGTFHSHPIYLYPANDVGFAPPEMQIVIEFTAVEGGWIQTSPYELRPDRYTRQTRLRVLFSLLMDGKPSSNPLFYDKLKMIWDRCMPMHAPPKIKLSDLKQPIGPKSYQDNLRLRLIDLRGANTFRSGDFSGMLFAIIPPARAKIFKISYFSEEQRKEFYSQFEEIPTWMRFPWEAGDKSRAEADFLSDPIPPIKSE